MFLCCVRQCMEACFSKQSYLLVFDLCWPLQWKDWQQLFMLTDKSTTNQQHNDSSPFEKVYPNCHRFPKNQNFCSHVGKTLFPIWNSLLLDIHVRCHYHVFLQYCLLLTETDNICGKKTTHWHLNLKTTRFHMQWTWIFPIIVYS